MMLNGRIIIILDKINEARFLSILDLASGYWHFLIHPQYSEKLAFVTNSGLYEWCRLPFGIKLGPPIFNRIIKRLLNKYKKNLHVVTLIIL